MPTGSRGRRSGGRMGNKRRGGPAIKQLQWSVPFNSDQPTAPLGAEGVLAIHNGAMRILEEIGIEFLNEEAAKILSDAGCRLDGTNVRMDREFVMEKVALAPCEFTITPRNAERRITIGGKHMVFGNVSSPPNCSDLERGRRPGDRAAFQDLVKFTQYFNCIHFAAGYPVEPLDIHPSVRHLECLYDKLTLTDKVMHGYCLGVERIEDAMEMVRIASGLTSEEFEAGAHMYTNINSSSPLKHDWPMMEGLMRMTRRGQPTIVTPFTLAGAMAPITMPGAVMQSVAEALSAIVLIQCIRPGTGSVMGSFTSNVDMKTGAPAFGTPDYVRATQMAGQMARFYGLPLRTANANAANCPDSQSAWESMMSLWAALTSGSNLVYHAAGWLEGGLCASYEKFVMDCETLQQMISYMKPVTCTAQDLAFDTIKEVGPNGHFFGAQHTQDRYETAFYDPFVSDWSNFENWRDAGSVQTPERANKLWKKILTDYEAPAMNEDVRQELADFVSRRKSEGGAPTDY